MTRTPRLIVTPLEDRLTPTTPLPVAQGVVVSGSGPGSSPMIQVYDGDGSLSAQFLAFDEAFTGGVNVAMADVNADGYADVIASAGAGGGPHVKVFDGLDVQNLPHPETATLVAVPPPKLLHNFFAYDVAFRGGVNVAVGELQENPLPDAVITIFPPPVIRENADILVGSGAGMKATVKGFNGRTGEEFFTLNPYGDFHGGVYVASGDTNGGGFDDVITGAGAGGGPLVSVYDGYTLGHLATILLVEGGPQPIHSFFAYGSAFRGGVRVGAGDLEYNARADIVTAAGPGGGPHIKAFSGHDATEIFSRFKYGLTPETPGYAAGSSIAAPYSPVRPVPVMKPPGGLVPLPVYEPPLPPIPTEFTLATDFTSGADEWSEGFADMGPLNQLDLDHGLRTLPAEVGTGTGFLLSGNNTSSDLFMYLKKNVAVDHFVVPNQTYRVDFTVTLASEVPAGLIGGGGPPAEGVFLKVGGGGTEPMPAYEENGDVRLNVDKGNQSTGGGYATVIGDIANGYATTDPRQYATITRTGSHTATSDSAGNLWLLVGTDSGFTGRTTLYYQSISVTLTPV